MKRFLVRMRQLGTKIVRILSEQKLLFTIISIILMFSLAISICLILLSSFYNIVYLFLGIVLLLFSWFGWALIGIVRDEEDFYF